MKKEEKEERRYKRIVEAIYRKAKEEKTDVRDLIRRWIMIFEESRVVGWDREEFFKECIRVKEEKKRKEKKK